MAACGIAAAQQLPTQPPAAPAVLPPWVAVKPVEPPATPLPSEEASASVTRFSFIGLWRHAKRDAAAPVHDPGVLRMHHDAVNLFDTVNYSQPDATLSSATFGQITGKRLPPRTIEFGAKMYF